jgi:hypothetical protein
VAANAAGSKLWGSGVVLLLGLVVAVWSGRVLLVDMKGLDNSLSEIRVPGDANLVFRAPGRYTFYHVYGVLVAGRLVTTGSSLQNLECSLTSKATGETVSLEHPEKPKDYSTGEHTGKSVYHIHLTKAGEYTFSCSFAKDPPSFDDLFFVDLSDPAEADTNMVLSGLIFLVAAIVSLVLAVRVTRKLLKA